MITTSTSASLRHGLARVHQQIREHLLDLPGIELASRSGRHATVERILQCRFSAMGCSSSCVCRITSFRSTHLRCGVLRRAKSSSCRMMAVIRSASLLIGQALFVHVLRRQASRGDHAGAPADDIQRCSQFVRDAGRQPTDGAQPIGMPQLLDRRDAGLRLLSDLAPGRSAAVRTSS